MPATRSAAHSSGVVGVGDGVGDGLAAAAVGLEPGDAGAAHPVSAAAPTRARAARVDGRLRRTRRVYAAGLRPHPGRRGRTEGMDDEHDRAILRRHAADGTLMAGGAAAILLQLADPRIAAGVARHSAFRERPLDRLDGTHQYLTALVFGDDRDIRHVVRVVNARHARVRGTEPWAYDARESDAQRWVAATILAVALELEERLIRRPLDPDTADALVRGYAPIAARLQGADAGWPASREEFDAWWAGRLSALDVGGRSRPPRRAGAARVAPPPHAGRPPGHGRAAPPGNP